MRLLIMADVVLEMVEGSKISNPLAGDGGQEDEDTDAVVLEDVFARVEVCVDILLYGYSYLPFVFLLASLRSLSWAALSASS